MIPPPWWKGLHRVYVMNYKIWQRQRLLDIIGIVNLLCKGCGDPPVYGISSPVGRVPRWHERYNEKIPKMSRAAQEGCPNDQTPPRWYAKHYVVSPCFSTQLGIPPTEDGHHCFLCVGLPTSCVILVGLTIWLGTICQQFINEDNYSLPPM